MSLKEQMEKDVVNVFFNDREFAEEKLVNGKLVLVIEDKDTFANCQQQGVASSDLLVFISVAFFEKAPVAGGSLMYGEQKKHIIDVCRMGGIYQLSLGRKVAGRNVNYQ